MRTERYILNAYYAKLRNAGFHLSDRCINFFKQFEDYDYIVNFFGIALAYTEVIEDRFFIEDEDEDDYEILSWMIITINSISELIMKFEVEHSFIIIDDEDDDE